MSLQLKSEMSAAGHSSARPRVMHVITGMGRGGAEKVAVQLSRDLGGSASLAWLSGTSEWDAELQGCCGRQSPLGIARLADLPPAVAKLSRFIRTENPDILHTHLSHAAIAARWAARRAGFRGSLISTEHNLGFYGRSGRLLMRLDRRSSRGCRAVAAISEAVRNHRVYAGWPAAKLRVIHNGVELPKEIGSPRFDSPLRLGMVGRLHPEKGPDVFVEVVRAVAEAEGTIITRGDDLMGLEKEIERSSVGHRVRIDRTSTPEELFSRADIVLVPSRMEGLGLAALEAMAHRRPVVAANTGGLSEVIVDGVTGILALPEQPDSFARAVRALAASPETARAMGSAGRARVTERFTLRRMLEQYAELYQEAAA